MHHAEFTAQDFIGLGRFLPAQAQAIIRMVKDSGALTRIPQPPAEGEGAVIAGGGRYLSWTWVLLRHLRHNLKSTVPVQVWHLGPKEMPEWAKAHLASLNATTVDAHAVATAHPVRELGGWTLKTYAVRHAPWQRVMFIDADCFPQVRPEDILAAHEGSLFFHDVGSHNSAWGYVDCGLSVPEREWETGQFIWDKSTGWTALQWALWMHEHTEVFFKTFHGDKGVIEAAFRISGDPHTLGPRSEWEGYGIGHYLDDRHAFKHMMATKRGEHPMDPWMRAAFEEWKSLAMGK